MNYELKKVFSGMLVVAVCVNSFALFRLTGSQDDVIGDSYIFKKVVPVQPSNDLYYRLKESVYSAHDAKIDSRRAEQIAKVTEFFARYGAKLQGYESIFVDKSQECGGDYRILVGIAGSESGLGRVNYKLYNPFGYLDGVQYEDQASALEFLSCQVSKQHISKCGTDLYCLADRYGGDDTDIEHFISKIRWFAKQVE